MDEEDSVQNETRLAALKVMEFFKSGMRLFVQYKGNRELALHAFCLAHGWGDLVGCESAVDVAKKLFKNPKKKAAVTKAIKLFQDSKGIGAMPGQRSEAGCRHMNKSRKHQLKTT